MPSLVRLWMEGQGRVIGFRTRDDGIPIRVGTAGMDQVNTSGPNPKNHPQPLDWDIMSEIEEIKWKLTGRPHSEDLSEEEREKLTKRLEELQDELRMSPDEADATYGLRVVPTTKSDLPVNIKPSDINTKE